MEHFLKIFSLFISLTLALGPTWVWAAPPRIWYLAHQGDQIGFILSTIGICPLWGEGNQVTATINLNPHLKKRHSDRLKKGEVIYLPVASLPPSEDYEVGQHGELKIFYVTPFRCSVKSGAVAARYPHGKFAQSPHIKPVKLTSPEKSAVRSIASAPESPVAELVPPVKSQATFVPEPETQPEPEIKPEIEVSEVPVPPEAALVKEEAVVPPKPEVRAAIWEEPKKEDKLAEAVPKPDQSTTDDDALVRSWLGVSARMSYQKFSGTDLVTGGKSVILSDLSPGVNLSWTQEWSDVDQTWISLGLDHVRLIKPKNRELVRSKLSLSEAQFGYQHSFGRRFYGGLRLSSDQVATFDVITATSLDFPSNTFFKAGGYLGYKFFRTKRMSLGVQAGIFGNAPASGSATKFSAGFREREYKLVIDHQGLRRKMTGSFYGRTEEYVSPLLKQTQSEMGFELGIHFQFLGD
jgi:hypothetical protein